MNAGSISSDAMQMETQQQGRKRLRQQRTLANIRDCISQLEDAYFTDNSDYSGSDTPTPSTDYDSTASPPTSPLPPSKVSRHDTRSLPSSPRHTSIPPSSPRRTITPLSARPPSRDQGLPVYIAYVCNLPQHALSPKGFQPYISRVKDLAILCTIPTRTGKMLVKSHDKDIQRKLLALRNIINLDVAIEGPRERLHPAVNTPNRPKPPSFSCVIKGVHRDISVDDVKQQLEENGIEFRDVWRIRSKQTNQFTRLVRVLTTNQAALDRMLSEGVWLFNCPHEVERSHPPPPQPFQCGQCQKYHQPQPCKEKVTCSYCTQNHHFGKCQNTNEAPKCANCGATGHVATSRQCPQRPKEPTSAAATAPLKSADQPEPDNAPASKHDVLRFVTLAILNAIPDQHTRVEKFITALAKTIFNVRMTINYGGGNVHIGIHPRRSHPRRSQPSAK